MIVRLNRERFESSLPDMAGRVVVAMVSTDMRSRQPLHPPAEVAIALWPKHQMKMVRQKAITEQPHRRPLAGLFHQLQERRIVTIFMKDGTTSVSTIQDVVTNIAQRYSRSSCHGRKPKEERILHGQQSSLTPLLSFTPAKVRRFGRRSRRLSTVRLRESFSRRAPLSFFRVQRLESQQAQHEFERTEGCAL